MAPKLLYEDAPGSDGLWLGIENRQVGHFFERNWLQRQAGLLPGSQTAFNHRDGHAFRQQVLRHASAGGFVNTSTVQVNLLADRKIALELAKRIRLQPLGTLYSLR